MIIAIVAIVIIGAFVVRKLLKGKSNVSRSSTYTSVNNTSVEMDGVDDGDDNDDDDDDALLTDEIQA